MKDTELFAAATRSVTPVTGTAGPSVRRPPVRSRAPLHPPPPSLEGGEGGEVQCKRVKGTMRLLVYRVCVSVRVRARVSMYVHHVAEGLDRDVGDVLQRRRAELRIGWRDAGYRASQRRQAAGQGHECRHPR